MGTAQALIRKRESMIFNMMYSKRIKAVQGLSSQTPGAAGAVTVGVEHEPYCTQSRQIRIRRTTIRRPTSTTKE
jgi:hypothetical protein